MSRLSQIIIYLLMVSVSSFSFATENTTFIVAGEDNKLASPFITVSADQGKTWQRKPLPFSSYEGSITDMACSSHGDSHFCAVIGQESKRKYSNTTFIYVSRDGGKSWQLSANDLPEGRLHSISCTGNKNDVLCVAVGEETNNHPMVFVTRDSGVTWFEKAVTLPKSYSLKKVSCTGVSSEKRCAITANSSSSFEPAMVVASTDQGETWNIKSIKEHSNKGSTLNDIHCNGEANTAICVATGYKQDDRIHSLPLVIMSVDGGHTFEEKTNIKKISDARFFSTHCSGINSDVFCVAGGAVRSLLSPQISSAVLITSQDGGKTWGKKPIKDLPHPINEENSITNVRCSSNGSCIAIGYVRSSNNNYLPLIAVSRDKGITWRFKTSPYKENDSPNKVYCNDASSDICIISGKKGVPEKTPLLLTSLDHGDTWMRNDSPDFLLEGKIQGIFVY